MSLSAEVTNGHERDYDLSLITCNPDGTPKYATGWPPRIINLGEYRVQVHETNNLYINIAQAKALRNELRVNPTAPVLGRAHDYYFGQGALGIFNTFEDQFTDLHARILDIYGRIILQSDKFNIDLLTERDLHCSYAFEHLAEIALTHNPDFELNDLTV